MHTIICTRVAASSPEPQIMLQWSCMRVSLRDRCSEVELLAREHCVPVWLNIDRLFYRMAVNIYILCISGTLVTIQLSKFPSLIGNNQYDFEDLIICSWVLNFLSVSCFCPLLSFLSHCFLLYLILPSVFLTCDPIQMLLPLWNRPWLFRHI